MSWITSRTRPAQVPGDSQVWQGRGAAQEGEEGGTAAAALQLCSNIQICLLSAAVIEGVSVIMY